nr:hypothetical protein [Tanacetum cinerariifolium]
MCKCRKRLTERSSEEKEESVLCTDDLRFVETHATEESVVSVSGSSFVNISLTRMLSGSFSSKLSPPCTVAEVVVVLLSAITGSLFSGLVSFEGDWYLGMEKHPKPTENRNPNRSGRVRGGSLGLDASLGIDKFF